MIPFPLQEEQNPPLRALRKDVLGKLTHQRFDLIVIGATPLARELVRLASHNAIRTAYLCYGDYVSGSTPARAAISEILSARYDGAVDLNHLEVLTLTRSLNRELGIACQCRISGERITVRGGAVLNQPEVDDWERDNSGPNKPRRGLGRLPVPRVVRPWFNEVLEEQAAVFRYCPGRFGTTNLHSVARQVLGKIMRRAGVTVKVVGLELVTLIDEIDAQGHAGSQPTQRAQRIINSFVEACSARGVEMQRVSAAIDRFGTRVEQITGLPRWDERIHPEFLRGEFHLSATTELARDTQELVRNRLGVILGANPAVSSAGSPAGAPFSRLENDLPELAALFEQLQHLDTF